MKTETKQAEKPQPTSYPDYCCQKCGHELDARGACKRCTAKPGDFCPTPDCGQKLSDGGATGGTYCKKCHQVFGATYPKPTPWGKKEDAHLAAVEAWLAAGQTRAAVEAMLDLTDKRGTDGRTGYERAARAFGQSPLAWERGRNILQEELRARDMRAEGMRVERHGDKVTTTTNAKRLRAARFNGKKAVHEPQDGAEAIRVAVADVLKARRGNIYLSMKAACLFQIKEHTLSIKWPALQKHVKKASKPSVTN
jgi:hypothetical protein